MAIPNNTKLRLHYIDAIRAFAILLMLEGHFVDTLLDVSYRDPDNLVYSCWKYMRGTTAPIFFTVTGFIFMFLLLKRPEKGWENPRIRKGIRRAIELIAWGYLLQLNLWALLGGSVNEGFFLIDVLHVIGLSLLVMIGTYLLMEKLGALPWLSVGLLVMSVGVFLLEPIYTTCEYKVLPAFLGNFFTKVNGSNFTLLPWLGYVALGGFLATLYLRWSHLPRFYSKTIYGLLIVGSLLVYLSSRLLMFGYELTDIDLLRSVAHNNYLFMRSGDVFIVFSIFLMARDHLDNNILTKIGSNTLSLYILHFVILYGSWFGLGLNRVWYHVLSPWQVIVGTALFMIVISSLVLYYSTYGQQHLMLYKEIFYTRFSAASKSLISGLKLKALAFIKR